MTTVIELTGSPYQKDERRLGPPLDCVSEKLRAALAASHRSARAADPETHPSARLSFYYAVVAYTALYVVLADWSQDINGLVKRLLQMGENDFEAWLDLVQDEGDVLGHGGTGKA